MNAKLVDGAESEPAKPRSLGRLVGALLIGWEKRIAMHRKALRKAKGAGATGVNRASIHAYTMAVKELKSVLRDSPNAEMSNAGRDAAKQDGR